MHPPTFIPGLHLTQEHLDMLKLNADNFLWPEEVSLLHHVLKLNELGLTWTEVEKGHFTNEYFTPVKFQSSRTSLGLTKIFPFCLAS
jgi:hypothetical protein